MLLLKRVNCGWRRIKTTHMILSAGFGPNISLNWLIHNVYCTEKPCAMLIADTIKGTLLLWFGLLRRAEISGNDVTRLFVICGKRTSNSTFINNGFFHLFCLFYRGREKSSQRPKGKSNNTNIHYLVFSFFLKKNPPVSRGLKQGPSGAAC